MPVRWRSRVSICAMYRLPFWLRSRSSSSSAWKPTRMVPPSTRLSGGSSAMASRMRLATSASSSSRSCRLRRRAACWVSKQRLSAGIFSSKRPPRSDTIARAGRAEGDFGQQAFQVEDAAEVLAQFGAQDGLLANFAHRIQALFDFGAVHGGPEQALAEQAAAHAGEGLVEHAKHGELGLRAAGVGGEDGFEQFQIAHGDGVEHHGIGAVVISWAVEMVERGPLRIAQVV